MCVYVCVCVCVSTTSPPNRVLRGGRDKLVAFLHCRPTTTTEDNVSFFRLKEMDER